MASGVKISDDIKTVIKDIQMGSKYKYIVLRITDDWSEVVVEKCADKDATYEMFKEDMCSAEQQKQCRWAVVDVGFETKSGMKKNKLVYFTWNPDTASVKNKMVYAASNDAVRKAIGNAVGVAVQATDQSELDECEVCDKIRSTDRA